MNIPAIVGLNFGDESKGASVDATVRDTGAKLVVRFNGGPQCSHTVVTSSGQSHGFSQFGSGTFVPDVRTFLSRYVAINPSSLIVEGNTLTKLGATSVFERMFVSPDAPVITPFHIAVNRIREWNRGEERHGSCGQGVGECVADSLISPDAVLRIKDLANRNVTQDKLEVLRLANWRNLSQLMGDCEVSTVTLREVSLLGNNKISAQISANYSQCYNLVTIAQDEQFIRNALSDGVVFEGGQGALLHQDLGFTPHVTWCETGFYNAECLMKEINASLSLHRVGIMRGYSTRHGAGPFVGAHSDFKNLPNERSSPHEFWQGEFRRGYFDMVLAKYAVEQITGPIDEIHVSCMDQMKLLPNYRIVHSYLMGKHA